MVCRTPAFLVLVCTVAACTAVSSPAAWGAEASDSHRALPDFFVRSVQPFLEDHCLDCHSGSDAEGGVELDTYASASSVTGDRRTWQRVLRMVRGREMPPEEMPQPEPDEVEAITRWIHDTLNDVDCSKPVNPGRVTIRRLNRVEYGNTIRDLVGVEFDAVERLPADDVGYGFDTIGDVLSLPPILMEKYLDAAEEIAAQAIVVDELDGVPVRRIEPDEASSTGGGEARGKARVLASSGEVFAKHVFPRDAEYVLRIEAFAQQAGDEPAKMGVRLDGQELKVFDVEAVEVEPAIYVFRTPVPAGEHRVSAAFLNDYYSPQAEDPNQRDRNLFVGPIEIVGPLRRGPEDLPEPHRRIFSATEGAGEPDRLAARTIVERLVSRAYRRPSRQKDVDRLMGLFDLARDQGEGFEAGVRLVLTGILVSPNFLFKIELDPPADGPADGRTPARRIRVGHAAVVLPLEQHARRRAVRRGPGGHAAREPRRAGRAGCWPIQRRRHWSRTLPASGSNCGTSRRSPRTRSCFRRSTTSFAGPCAPRRRCSSRPSLREDRSVLELIDADFTFVNERLARHYGIEGVEGEEFRRVSLDGSPRGGRDHAGERADGDVESHANVAGQAGQVDHGEHPRHAAARAAAERAHARRERRRGPLRHAAPADGAAPQEPNVRRLPPQDGRPGLRHGELRRRRRVADPRRRVPHRRLGRVARRTVVQRPCRAEGDPPRDVAGTISSAA